MQGDAGTTKELLHQLSLLVGDAHLIGQCSHIDTLARALTGIGRKLLQERGIQFKRDNHMHLCLIWERTENRCLERLLGNTQIERHRLIGIGWCCFYRRSARLIELRKAGQIRAASENDQEKQRENSRKAISNMSHVYEFLHLHKEMAHTFKKRTGGAGNK